MTVKILSVLDNNEQEFTEELIKGCIGETAGNFFLKFLQDHKGLEIVIPDFTGKETEFRLPYPDRHDHVSQIMASMVYYLEQNPKKYMELWIQVINVLHNEENKYGNYASYDNLIMKYLFDNIKLLLDSKVLLPSEIKEFSKRVPCYNLLSLTGS